MLKKKKKKEVSLGFVKFDTAIEITQRLYQRFCRKNLPTQASSNAKDLLRI
jgi:hypothetical protein